MWNITIDPKSKLYSIIVKINIMVNSTHLEHIINVVLYIISSFSNDGIIESIEYNKNKFNIGGKFHLERFFDDKNMINIFDAFIRSL